MFSEHHEGSCDTGDWSNDAENLTNPKILKVGYTFIHILSFSWHRKR